MREPGVIEMIEVYLREAVLMIVEIGQVIRGDQRDRVNPVRSPDPRC